MKKVFTYALVVLMASLVFYGGAGINIVSFCCSDCKAAGLEAVTTDKCCEIHEHEHSHGNGYSHTHSHDQHHHPATEPATDPSAHAEEDCCNMQRIDFDWDFEQIAKQNPDPVIIDLFVMDHHSIQTISIPFVDKMEAVMPHSPPLPPGTYLSLLTTLLI
ncbi:hypothetical protein LJC44_03535 [Parabacteroides sp. OttesenSCG-928-G06]|nr:hypothetical protein [Parabacteroides sp. OttesenSCG-928-K15]MDL2282174.1 hypothetical protein [Parabacteroides sp. OttesenSCG-928-G06]